MKRTLFFAILLIFSAALHSQSTLINRVVATGGGYGAGTSANLSWTVGDLVVDKLTSANNAVTAGFQQSWQLALNIDLQDSNWEVNLYPNPVYDYLNIRFGPTESDKVTIDIIGATGRLIRSFVVEGAFEGRIEQFSLSDLKTGIYMVRIYNEEGNLNRTMRIIKN